MAADSDSGAGTNGTNSAFGVAAEATADNVDGTGHCSDAVLSAVAAVAAAAADIDGGDDDNDDDGDGAVHPYVDSAQDLVR